MLDGCHKYGWLISIVMQALLLAYFFGSLTRSVDDLSARVVRIENLVLEGKVKP